MEESGTGTINFQKDILLLSISVSLVMTGFAIIFPIFPKLLEVVGQGDAGDLGKLAAVFGVSMLIFSPIFGNAADKFGKKKIILIGLLGFSLSNFIYVIANDMKMLYIARIAEGAFSAAIIPPSIALTIEISPSDRRGKYLGYISAAQTLGLIIGPLLGGVLYEGISIKNQSIFKGSLYLPFYVSAGFGFVTLIWSYFQLPAGNLPHKRINLEKKSEKEKNGKLDILRKQYMVLPRPRTAFFMLVLVEIIALSGWIIIEPGFIFYFYDELLLTPTEFGIFVGAFGLFATLGQVFLGNISDKYGRIRIMLIGQVFAFLFYVLLPFAKTIEMFVIVVIIVAIGSGLREPAMKALLSDHTEPEHISTVFGIESGLMNIRQIIGPVIGGYLYVQHGMQFLFYIAILVSFSGIWLIPLIKFSSNTQIH